MEHEVGKQANELGVLLRVYRRRAHLTQREFAAKAGLSVAFVRDLEQGRRSSPRPDSLAALGYALGLDAAQAAVLARAAASSLRRQPDATIAASDRRLRLSVLGPLEASLNGSPLHLGPPARRAVLGLLAAEHGGLLRRDAIIDAIWGQWPPATATNLVQAHVSRLRKVLDTAGNRAADDSVITSAGSSYRLRLRIEELDLLVFRDLVACAAAASANGDYQAACDLYGRAVAMWRGDPLGDVDLLRGHPAITGLGRELADALIKYAELACELGLHDQVLPRLWALAAAEPFNERVHALLIIALAGSGQQASALGVYEEIRLRLDREFGAYPGEDLAVAHSRVLHQDIPSANRQRELRRTPGPAVAGHVVPRQLPAVPRYFIGRASDRKKLTDLLNAADWGTGGILIAAMTGMAGVGKTALALRWAHEVEGRFPDGQLFTDMRGYSPSGGPRRASESVRDFLTALGVPPASIPPDENGQVTLYRSLLAGRRVLIVLDNASDAEQIRPLLPGAPGCAVLVTSRNQLTGLAAAEGAHLLPLDPLPESEAYSLLTASLGPRRAMDEPAVVSDLIGLCGRLPLALRAIGARAAARPGLPLATLATGMRDIGDRLDGLETGEPTTSVRTLFSWSRPRLSARAMRVFRGIGAHPRPDITVASAASLATLPCDLVHSALTELCDENLIVEYAEGRFTCHDLLHAYAAEEARIR
jgi:DNA-binding SARP family transcriptional activator